MASEPPQEKSATVTDHDELRDGEKDLKSSDAVADAAIRGQAITGYEDLTPWQTVKQFKMATALCFAAAFSAATDGYQIGSVQFNRGSGSDFLLTLL